VVNVRSGQQIMVLANLRERLVMNKQSTDFICRQSVSINGNCRGKEHFPFEISSRFTHLWNLDAKANIFRAWGNYWRK
jgi:hypothetical protein